MSEPPKMAERLLAHEKLCKEVASECWDNELAADFNKLALECIEAEAATEPPERHLPHFNVTTPISGISESGRLFHIAIPAAGRLFDLNHSGRFAYRYWIKCCRFPGS
jgi:hypothetical protein